MESKQKTRIGVVVSNKMDKTAVVKVTRTIQHRRYSKILRRSKKYKIHDCKNECSQGDTVKIVETRPMSRDKRWRLVEIIGKTT